jgi:DNA polymerase elongation subunit (family B)
LSDPKILIIDIETSPNLVHTWGVWNQNIGPDQMVKESEMLCWGAKWYMKPGHMYEDIHNKQRMIKHLWTLLNEADIVVHYNGKKFDIPIINTALLLARLYPPSPYKQVDLIDTIKHKFKFQYARLGYVCPALKLGEKHKNTGFKLWQDCMAGKKCAWIGMKKYNLQDVDITEALYNEIKPWIDKHPRIYDNERTCPYCNSSKVYRKQAKIAIKHSYVQMHCQSCGKHYPGPKVVKNGT